MINNRNAFKIYITISLLLYFSMFFLIIGSIPGIINKDLSIIRFLILHFGIISIIVLSVFFLFYGIAILFDYLLKPSYIEADFRESEVVIRTFRSEWKNLIKLNSVLHYQNHLNEIRVTKQEYNDYKLLIDNFGLRRRLIIQKINKAGIHESSEINISLIGLKKYSELILLIDRLKGKLNLN